MGREDQRTYPAAEDRGVRPGSTPAELSEREAKRQASRRIKLYDATFNGRRVKVTIPED